MYNIRGTLDEMFLIKLLFICSCIHTKIIENATELCGKKCGV